MNVPYHLGRYLGNWRRAWFARNLEQHIRRARALGPELPFRIVSLSGERDFPEQVASWLSLLRHLGTPREFLLVSDGSHTSESVSLLEKLPAPVRVCRVQDFLRPDTPACIHRYAAQSPMGKKLAVFNVQPELTPMLYADSDILFFPGAGHLLQLLATGANVLYLPDCAPSFDPHLIHSPEEAQNPVNAGFLYLRQPISIEKGLSRFHNPQHPVSFFSEQTIVHLAVHEAHGQPLPGDRYIMRAEDQFRFGDAYAGPHIAMRHYISSIRYKMWQQAPVF
jgi:hypothetical protein